MMSINKIKQIIRKYGIKKYIKQTNFKATDINGLLASYHAHTFVFNPRERELTTRPVKPPPIKFKKNTIIFPHYFGASNAAYIKKYKSLVQAHIARYPRSIVLDFTNHTGGNMHPHLAILWSILGPITLFAWGQTRVSRSTPSWLNLKEHGITQGAYSKTPLSYTGKIVIKIGPRTQSSGEILAAIFCGRSNATFRGSPTGGFLSVNNFYKVSNTLTLNLTVALLTTFDGKFHSDEKLSINNRIP